MQFYFSRCSTREFYKNQYSSRFRWRSSRSQFNLCWWSGECHVSWWLRLWCSLWWGWGSKHDSWCQGTVYILAQWAFNPHKMSLWGRGSTWVLSSFRYTFMHYFSYKIGLFFAFFSFKVYRDILKYIGILDLVRVGQYWQKPLWYSY